MKIVFSETYIYQQAVRRPRKKSFTPCSYACVCVCVSGARKFCSSSSPTVKEFLKSFLYRRTHTDNRNVMRMAFNVSRLQVSMFRWKHRRVHKTCCATCYDVVRLRRLMYLFVSELLKLSSLSIKRT